MILRQIYRIKNEKELRYAEIQFNDFLDEIAKQSSVNMNENEGVKLIGIKYKEAMAMMRSINGNFKDSVESDTKNQFEKLRNDYQEHVADILKNSLPEGISGNIVEFQSALLEMKPVEKMVADNKIMVTEVVSQKIESQKDWYNPFTWLKGDKITDIHGQVIKINISNAFGLFAERLQDEFDRSRDNYEKHLSKNLDSIKKTFLKEMDGIDRRVKEIFTDLQNAENDKEEKEKQLIKAKNNIQWHEDFRKKVSKILDIKGVHNAD